MHCVFLVHTHMHVLRSINNFYSPQMKNGKSKTFICNDCYSVLVVHVIIKTMKLEPFKRTQLKHHWCNQKPLKHLRFCHVTAG